MEQNMFTYGSKRDEFTDEDAKLEFERIEEELLEQMHQFELPKALSAENMMQLLDGVTPGVTQPARVINYKKEYAKFIACAACLVLVITGFARMVKSQNEMIATADASASGAFNAVSAASSAEAVTEEAAVETKSLSAAQKESADTAPAAPAERSIVTGGAAPGSAVDDLDGASVFSDKAAEETMLVVIDGTLYKSSGVMIEPTSDDKATGEITYTVASDATPEADCESNFGVGYKYRVNGEEIEVLIDGAWYCFVKAQ